MKYEASIDPTAVTSIILPAVNAEPEPERTIALDYYDATEDPNAVGLLESVTDLNGVRTVFEFDQYGQLDREIELFAPTR